jgi:hypothetical protein
MEIDVSLEPAGGRSVNSFEIADGFALARRIDSQIGMELN